MKKKRKEENNKKIHGKEKPNQKKLPIGITILVVLSILASIYLIYNILLLGPIEKVIRYIIIAIIIVIDVAILVRNVRMLRRGKTKKHRLFIFVFLENWKRPIFYIDYIKSFGDYYTILLFTCPLFENVFNRMYMVKV